MSLEGQQFDHYRFLRLLGSGGMGSVYLAEDIQLRRTVAIKVIWTDTALYPDDAAAREAARLFVREAQLIAQLDHPHILPLYAWGESLIGGRSMMYMVMPYRRQGSLADWLRRHEDAWPLLPWQVERIVHQAASALQHAHDHRIIHRDVKPANFLIHGSSHHPNELNVQLADFGVAKFAMTTSHSQVIRGTPLYMAPEQWEGRPVPATDQYALAIMAYELLTGAPPFVGESHQHLWHQHAHLQPRPASAFNPAISAALDSVLLHALEKNPRNRFRSVAAFADAFQHTLLPVERAELVSSLRDASLAQDAPPDLDSDDSAEQIGQTRSRPIGRVLLLLAILFLLGAGVLGALSISRQDVTNRKNTAVLRVGTTATSRSTAFTPQPNITATTSAQAMATASAIAATVSAQETASAVADMATANAQAMATASAVAATATAYATGVAYGTRLLNDPMQDNSRGYGWDVNTIPGGGGCAFTQGTYHASMPQNGYLAPCFAESTNFSNFTYQVQMTILTGDQGGISFRATAGSGAFYYFHINRKGQYALEKFNGLNGVEVLTLGGSSTIKTGLGQPNLVAVVADGNTFSLYVNMQLVATASDSSGSYYSHGQVGVIAEDTGVATDITFSNAQVWVH